MEYAALSGRKSLASSSISSKSLSLSSSQRDSIGESESFLAAYLLLCSVMPPAMEQSAADSAPTSAAAPPPPGVGSVDASADAKVSRLMYLSSIVISSLPESVS